jgi:hypothetical protein
MFKVKQYKKGIYSPINRKKYLGTENPVYRSSYELYFFRWCDNNPRVLEWTSESVVIPYKSPLDEKFHKYYVDNSIVYKINDTVVKKFLIELKPYKQTIAPTKNKNKKDSTFITEATTFAKNQAKWEAAKKWCEGKGFDFLILTEKQLFPNGKS